MITAKLTTGYRILVVLQVLARQCAFLRTLTFVHFRNHTSLEHDNYQIWTYFPFLEALVRFDN